jgi:hypothetical protein
MAIGETSKIESTDKEKVQTLTQKVQDLNSRLQDVRREQIFQRVGKSSATNESTVDSFLGTGSRVPRPVRDHKLPRRSMDDYTTRRSWCYLRVAALASAGILHQAEAYLDIGDGRGLGEVRRTKNHTTESRACKCIGM